MYKTVKKVNDELFKTEFVTKKVIRIKDIAGDSSYIIKGNEKSILVDCGVGIGNIKKYIQENLTIDIEDVILTHGHIDHTGGCSYFKNVYMNKKDQELFMIHYNKKMQQNHLKMNSVNIELIDDSLYAPLVVPDFIQIDDSTVFNLGGLTVKINCVPSHTQGEVVIYIEEEKILITGDACNNFIFMFSDNSSFIPEYKNNLENLYKAYKGKISRILVSHEPGEEKVNLIENVIQLCNEIIDHKTDDIEAHFFGKTVYIAKKVDENNNRSDGIRGNIVYKKF